VSAHSHSNFKQRKDMRPHSRGAMRPRFASTSPSFQERGRRESRMPIAPAVVRTKGARVDHRFNRIIRLSLRNGLRLMACSSRGDQLCSPRRFGIDDAPEPGRAKMHLPKLDASLGRQVHTTSPSAPISAERSTGTRGPAKFWRRRLAAPFVARRIIAHGKPALRSLARPTLSRPSHPTAQFVTTRDPPLPG